MPVCRQMGRYCPKFLHVWHGAGLPITFQSEVSISENITQVVGKIPKAQEAAMSSEIDTMLYKRTIKQGLGKTVHLQEKWDK